MDEDYLARLSDALVSEIKAEMGRRGVSSSRALGRLIDRNSQYMSMRLDGGNPKTGERVVLNVQDIAAIGSALNVHPAELVRRAKDVADSGGPEATVTPLPTRPSVPAPTVRPRVAKKSQEQAGAPEEGN